MSKRTEQNPRSFQLLSGAANRTKTKPSSLRRARQRSSNWNKGNPGSAEADAGQLFEAPVQQARAEARRIINEAPNGNYLRIIEGWKQLPSGEIQFTIRTVIRCEYI
jgi:hypothetical protein